MKENSKKMLMGAMVLVGIASLGAYSVSAYQGDLTKRGPNYSPERHEIMVKAFESNDYDTWKKEMESSGRRGRVMDVVNKDNFSKFRQAWQLRNEGRYDEANKLRAELGLGGGYGRSRSGNLSNNRGKNLGGHFVDENNDGICDNLK